MQAYTSLQKTLHWLMGLLIIGLFVVGFIMVDMAPGESKWSIYGFHKSFGFLVLVFFFVRLSARLMTPPNIVDHSVSNLHYMLIKLSVPVLYIIMLMMPLSGFIMSDAGGYAVSFFGLFEVPSLFKGMKSLGETASWVHHNLAPFAAGIVVLHMMGAFFHHFILKDDTLTRMLPSKK